MKRLSPLGIIFAFAALAFPAEAQQLPSPAFGNQPLNVKNAPYNAKCDGVTNDYAAFAAAFATASLTGATVIVPAGVCVIDATAGGSLLATNLTLEGETVAEGTAMSTAAHGSNIWIKGTTNAPFQVRRGLTVRGITFYYPDQTNTNPPVTYPATFKFDTAQNDIQFVRFEDNTFINSYDAIDMTMASGGVGHVWVVNNNINGLHRGIIVSRNVELIKILGNTFSWGIWVGVADGSPVITYTRASGASVEWSRGDGIWFADNLFFGTDTGILINPSAGNVVQGATIVGNYWDNIGYGIRITGAGNFTHSQITGNGFFAEEVPAGVYDLTKGSAIYADNTGVAFTDDWSATGNAFVWSGKNAIHIVGGAPRNVAITGNNFASVAALQTSGSYGALYTNATLTNVRFVGNSVSCPATIYVNGIQADYVNWLTATSNQYVSCNNAIQVSGSAAVTHTGNISAFTIGTVSEFVTTSRLVAGLNAYDKPVSALSEQPYTVATLPACSAALKGQTAFVTDAAATPVYNAIVAGGGSTAVKEFCNGTNWVNQ